MRKSASLKQESHVESHGKEKNANDTTGGEGAVSLKCVMVLVGVSCCLSRCDGRSQDIIRVRKDSPFTMASPDDITEPHDRQKDQRSLFVHSGTCTFSKLVCAIQL